MHSLRRRVHLLCGAVVNIKMPGRFGQWNTGAEERVYELVCRDQGGYYHAVDVYQTQEEWESVAHKPEPCGWTYVADDDGVEDLRRQYFSVCVFHTNGHPKEDEEE